ncbi:adenosine deaminase 2-like [Mytilus edulis]|uniref:adenosine deaminase 2-like n=1 Tax=Mytilus edulis TaxID=6550 RepID=UPI0039EF5DA9
METKASICILAFYFFLTCIKSSPLQFSKETYLKTRQSFLDAEEKLKIGGNLTLTAKEEKANAALMRLKYAEINASRNGAPFPPSMHFFKGKPIIEKSSVFKILQKMPKGGALHLHDISLTDIWWIVKNVTYRPNCYMCQDVNKSSIKFHFFANPPQNPGCPWMLVSQQRQVSGDASKFDQMLYNSMSLVVDDPVKTYPTIDAVWAQFLHCFDVANGMVNYLPVFKDYFYEALNEFRLDNVQYIELRGLLPQVYDLNGRTYDKTTVMQIYQDVFNQFKRDHKDFSGGKYIYSSIRIKSPTDILGDVKLSLSLKTNFPEYFAGYDLVGQEDPGKSLLYYIDPLLYPKQQNPPIKLPYFFHAGETDWEGTPTDDNLIDAVLLNTTRIGHGYALTKHPKVLQAVKQKQIAIEVNPISNQVLKLVDDLRNHPAASLIAEGYPVVISADDPSVWGARGLSYDFYMAFMGMAGEDADLKFLKQLALNSLQFSAMTPQERSNAMNLWKYKWDTFIEDINEAYWYHNHMERNGINTSLIFG